MAATLCTIAACAPATPEQQLLDEAVTALGGRDRILAVRTLVLEGNGRHFNLGQDVRPGASDQTFTVTGLKRQVDVGQQRARLELTRTPNFAYFQGQAPQRQVQGIDGQIAFNVAANGNASRIGAAAAEDRRADFYHHPVTLLAAALSARATVSNVRREGAERRADITVQGGPTVAVSFDGGGLPIKAASRSYHPNLGDVVLSTEFSDFQDTEGLRLPRRFVSKTDDFTTADISVTGITVNGTVDDLVAPAAVAAAGLPSPPPPTVVPELVAPGVWLLAGQSHHSALIELSDHAILVEAPQSEARTLAVIAKARELVPQKPLRDLISTHHHFDHTAGMRAAIAQGLRVVTHADNKAFVEEMAARPHTIVPDALAKDTKPVVVETVDSERTISDPMRTVAIYHVAGNPHSDTMVMVHLPSERVLIEVDAFSPGAGVNPYAANLLDNIERRNLRVDRIVPLHGAIAPFADLTKLRVQQTN